MLLHSSFCIIMQLYIAAVDFLDRNQDLKIVSKRQLYMSNRTKKCRE